MQERDIDPVRGGWQEESKEQEKPLTDRVNWFEWLLLSLRNLTNIQKWVYNEIQCFRPLSRVSRGLCVCFFPTSQAGKTQSEKYRLLYSSPGTKCLTALSGAPYRQGKQASLSDIIISRSFGTVAIWPWAIPWGTTHLDRGFKSPPCCDKIPMF